jgi:HD-GYP domain-containing protein (c-di-GMP phosphodiesterase class II)
MDLKRIRPMSPAEIVHRGRDDCHVSFRHTLDLLKVTDEALAELCLECRTVPSQDAILLRALNEVAGSDPGIGQYAPSHVLFAHGEGPELTSTLYALGPGGYAPTGTPIRFDLERALAVAMGFETVAVSNSESDPLSLQEYQELFLPEVRERIGVPIRNFISYRISGDRPGAIVAYNYPMSATRYAAQVLSGLAVTLGAFGTLATRVGQVEEAFLYLVGALARASEVNDEVTGAHILRVSRSAERLAKAASLSDSEAWVISYSSQLHDVGKIHTPPSILRKPAGLTPEEVVIMRQHTLQGEKIIGSSSRLIAARRIAGGHHENWDGSGYPRGLAGEAIPFEARLVKIVDVYDALRSERPYKGGYTHEEACEILFRGDRRIDPAKHFDPSLLAAFREVQEDFRRIHAEVESLPDSILPDAAQLQLVPEE